jgi:hypothetical protein
MHASVNCLCTEILTADFCISFFRLASPHITVILIKRYVYNTIIYNML